MELKEYYKIWRENISVVIYAALIAVVAAYIWSVRQSETYSASFILNISRLASQNTGDYRYDQFYRFQADEKFAETAVEWLSAPGVAKDILANAGVESEKKTIRQLGKSFQAEKLSSSLVEVRYSARSKEEGEKLAAAASSFVSDKTKKMNSEAKDPNWFLVDMTNLVVARNIQDLRINLGIAALFGFFAGTLIAFGKHYFSEE
ncbi:MAG: hypothetical protein UX02_C0002G0302 [Candidatus Moranbacteria bacterium GW2011_GWC1_45_18]|nr:MAG: hypothetical protein UT79_C0001G0159 [Candidatus Moranbacteria bacterium GW2011_GWC2_40_12]KKT33705.1 MAG: hypothetical protein UW19_C0006G0007 [Candidatus Moranbacteria bacterium GW2011_GWF2_44_10]KKT72356.1 MAG: hypothetical protein UW66_C0005G0010 [Candidatus Moranbacteria bacterium GW2011_GWF1_44_4]KKT99983.1 MAG: hypothetical protein UX02_C0002G0302 [Candidatus Moranbacteria bacterium GW2011_GWC1_45_18]OGI24619.1 MAG: hypothetical protein A2194_01930 [Candidatus Moranbacteria bacte